MSRLHAPLAAAFMAAFVTFAGVPAEAAQAAVQVAATAAAQGDVYQDEVTQDEVGLNSVLSPTYYGQVVASPGELPGMVNVSWDDPADPAVTGFEVEWSATLPWDGDWIGGQWVPAPATWTRAGVSVNGLTAVIDTGISKEIAVRVRAVDVNGPQPDWWPVASSYPASFQLSVAESSLPGVVGVTWTAVTSQTQPVADYRVTWRKSGWGTDWRTDRVTVSGTSARVAIPSDLRGQPIDVRVQARASDGSTTMEETLEWLEAGSLNADAQVLETPGAAEISWDPKFGNDYVVQWAPITNDSLGAWRSTGVTMKSGGALIQTPYPGGTIAWRVLTRSGDVAWEQDYNWLYLNRIQFTANSGPRAKQLTASWRRLPASAGVTTYRVDRLVGTRFVAGPTVGTASTAIISGYSGEQICLRLVVLVGTQVTATEETCGRVSYDPQAPNPHRPKGNSGGVALPPSNGRGDVGLYGYTVLGQRVSLDAVRGRGTVAEGFMDESTVRRSWDPDRDGKSEHNGVDIRAVEGTPVYATVAGQITKAGNCRCWAGIQVVITMPTGARVTYAHMSAATVTVGQRVLTGTQIGAVGNTGNSYGSHLHVSAEDSTAEWVVDGYTDPVPFMDIGPSARTVAAAKARGLVGKKVVGTVLVQDAFKRAGVKIPGTVKDLKAVTQPVATKQLVPGDLVFFGKTLATPKVGIYLGKGQVAHTRSLAKGVTIASLTDAWAKQNYAGARRVKV